MAKDTWPREQRRAAPTPHLEEHRPIVKLQRLGLPTEPNLLLGRLTYPDSLMAILDTPDVREQEHHRCTSTSRMALSAIFPFIPEKPLSMIAKVTATTYFDSGSYAGVGTSFRYNPNFCILCDSRFHKTRKTMENTPNPTQIMPSARTSSHMISAPTLRIMELTTPSTFTSSSSSTCYTSKKDQPRTTQ